MHVQKSLPTNIEAMVPTVLYLSNWLRRYGTIPMYSIPYAYSNHTENSFPLTPPLIFSHFKNKFVKQENIFLLFLTGLCWFELTISQPILHYPSVYCGLESFCCHVPSLPNMQSWALALYFQVPSPLSAHFISMDLYRSSAHLANFQVRSSLNRSQKNQWFALVKER